MLLKLSHIPNKFFYSQIHNYSIFFSLFKNQNNFFINTLNKSRKISKCSLYPVINPNSTNNNVEKIKDIEGQNIFSNENEGNSFIVENQKVYIEIYGCQMNINDAEIVTSILKKHGYKETKNIEESDVAMLMTCSIREGAEDKVARRLRHMEAVKKRRGKKSNLQIAVLGCMAERLKTRLLQLNKYIDVICGPDAYRSLPRLLHQASEGMMAANVTLSMDETYADIQPIRRNPNSPSAFISTMRGCNNMCTYCVVPFTRGRERSRSLFTVVREVRELVDQGIKDITLLGQNVNSYHDNTASKGFVSLCSSPYRPGFKTVYKKKEFSKGVHYFIDLLDSVSMVNKNVRIRFTSPHPKDFPDEVLELMRERPNICKHLHIPAQSGSDSVLERMGRGYTRDQYEEVIRMARTILPEVSLSSDFIAGFCGEEEDDHQASLDLIHRVGYNIAFCFPFSIREKTRAHHRLVDNVAPDVKKRRAEELVVSYRRRAFQLNQQQVGRIHLVLAEGVSKRSFKDMYGRNDGNIKVIFPNQISSDVTTGNIQNEINVGDYVAVKITSCSSQVLKGLPLFKTTLVHFHKNYETNNLINNNNNI